jgi:hypothetical protein
MLRRLGAKNGFSNIFGSDAFEEASNGTKEDEVFNGTFFANARVVPEFIQLYHETYHNMRHHTFAAGTFDFSNLLLEAAHARQACSREELLVVAKSGSMRSGALGVIQYKESQITGGYFASEIAIKNVATQTK